MEEIDLKEFLTYLLKHIALIIIVPILLMVSIIGYDLYVKKPMYSTYSTLVLVASSSATKEEIGLNTNDITLNQKLVATYSEFIKSNLVLDQVIKKLGLNMTNKELSKRVKVEAIKDTVIIKITVQNGDPEMAMLITNEIANTFGKEVVDKFEIDNVAIIDTAKKPSDVSNNTLVRDIAIALAGGIALSSGILFVFFYFDDSVKYKEDLEEEAGLPIIGKIYSSDKKTDLIVEKYPNDLTSEAIRTLRTNLRFSSVDKKQRSIAITSTSPNEGKSFISVNLAESFATTGKKVLLIDCDLRKGRIHRIFDVMNVAGISNYLIDDEGRKLEDYITHTSNKDLDVITRGDCPPNPSELLNSKKFSDLINKIKKMYDVIIVDCPPCNGLSDALIISTLVDDVLIVSKEGKTTKTSLKNAKKQLENVNAHITGNVLNGINITKYAYGKYYYYSEDNKKKRKKK